MADSRGSESNLGALFKVCDLDGSGFIDQQELSRACTELSKEDLREVFAELDKDGDGRISIEEFAKGFVEIAGAAETKKREKFRQRLRSSDGLLEDKDDRGNAKGREEHTNDIEEFVGSLDEGLRALSCQEQVVELYQRLHTGEQPDLLDQFESILLGVIKDVRQYQLENERLEKTFKREKEQHDRHLRQLEEEMEQQMQKVEERVRKQEQERLEQEKADLRSRLDTEINSLQDNLKRLQQDGLNRFDREQEIQIQNMRMRLEEIQGENRSLKSELIDSQTNLALVRSELTTFRQQFRDKCRELDQEKEAVMDYVKEQDSLTRQLHMLQDSKKLRKERKVRSSEANKKLHDINDDLRMAVESSRALPTVLKRSLSNDSAASTRSGSPRTLNTTSPQKSVACSDYVDSSLPGNRSSSTAANSSLFEEISLTQSPTDLRLLRCEPSFDEESLAEDIGDSGHSTMRDNNEVDTEIDSVSMDGETRRPLRRHKRARQGQVTEEDEPDSHDEMETDNDIRSDFESRFHRASSVGSRGSVRSLNREDSVVSHGSRGSQRSQRRQLPMAPQEPIIPVIMKVTREPERMYKVVLAGDAAVGKSSFIVRLCKGKFVPNLSSTLGVDFQTKVLEVDNHTVALQLWDTAGQERFRSIAKSYFRRADGVLLMYDCTYERSFINVREWMSAVEESSPKKIPVMLVGNKTDQRQDLQNQGRRVVRQEDGQRLSREIDALFIETSAKDGSNIMEAVIELTRMLRTNEDLEVKTVGMQLQEMRNERKSSCCGGSK